MSHKSKTTWGMLLLFAGFLLIVIGTSNIWLKLLENENYEVRWYKRGGVQTVNGQVQYTTIVFEPSDGEPTKEEIEQLLSNMDFFSKYNLNQQISTNVADIQNLRVELYNRGYQDLGVNLVAIEVAPARPQFGLTIGLFGFVIASLFFVLARRKYSSRK